MSIKFGTSMTRRRRAYDRRCRGARDGAMAATTAIPPRRDRKRKATRARASAGMQMRGANVQHSNAQGRSATGGCTAYAAGLSGAPRRYHLVPVRASRLWITSVFAWISGAGKGEPSATNTRILLRGSACMIAVSGICGSSGDLAPARPASLVDQMLWVSGIRGFAGAPAGSWQGVPPALRAGRHPHSLHTPQPSTLTQAEPLNAAFTPTAANWSEDAARVQARYPDATWRRARRDAF